MNATESADPTIPALLSPETAARVLDVTVDTLADWRCKGGGPPYVRLGQGHRGRVRYPAALLHAWIGAHAVVRSTADYDARTPAHSPRQLDLRALVMGEGAGI